MIAFVSPLLILATASLFSAAASMPDRKFDQSRAPSPLISFLDERLRAIGISLESAYVGCGAYLTGCLYVGVTVGAKFGVGLAVTGVAGTAAAYKFRVAALAKLQTNAVPILVESFSKQIRAGFTEYQALMNLPPSIWSDQVSEWCRGVDAGERLPDMLTQFARNKPNHPASGFARIVVVSARLGGQSSDALDAYAQSVRSKLSALAEAKALSAQAQLSGLVISLAPVAFLAFTTIVDSKSSQFLFSSPTGLGFLGAGLGMNILAWKWMRHIVGGVTK